MPAALRTAELLDAVVQRVRTFHGEPSGATFGFKLMQAGGLEALVAREDYAADLPALIATPEGSSAFFPPRTVGGEVWEWDLFVRLLVVRPFEAGLNVERDHLAKVDLLAQTFMDNGEMGAPVFTDAVLMFALIERVDWRAEEAEGLREAGRADIFGSAVVVRCRMRTQN